MTITTSPTVSINSNSTSSTDARIVVVRSVRIVNVDGRRQVAFKLRQELLNAIDDLNDVGARLALDVDDDGGRLIHPGSELYVLHVVDHLSDVRENHGRAVVIGDDDLLKILAGEELIVRVDLIILMRTVEIALGGVEAGLLQRRANVLEIDAIGRQRGGIHLHADGGFLSAADTDQTDAGKLRNFLREARVREVLNLRERNRV